MQHSPTPLLNLPDAIPLDALLQRFNSGDRGLRARLCLVGGTGGELFLGDLSRAKKVEAMTSAVDPDGRSWLPVDMQRRAWVKLSAEEWVRAILNRSALRG